MADESTRDDEAQSTDETGPEERQTSDRGPEGTKADDRESAEREWKDQIGESYRRFVSWLSDEIDTLDRVSREKFKGAVSEINERFPPEERKRLVQSAESEIQEFLGELRDLGGRLRRNPNVARFEEKGAEALRSSAARVRQWAQNVEGSLSPTDEERRAEEDTRSHTSEESGEEE